MKLPLPDFQYNNGPPWCPDPLHSRTISLLARVSTGLRVVMDVHSASIPQNKATAIEMHIDTILAIHKRDSMPVYVRCR